jgi:hypothetical protein
LVGRALDQAEPLQRAERRTDDGHTGAQIVHQLIGGPRAASLGAEQKQKLELPNGTKRAAQKAIDVLRQH